MKYFCSIISCFLAITILISSSVVTAHAAAVPSIGPWWGMLGQLAREEATPDQGYVGVDGYLKSVFSLKDSGCPSSQSKNGCHFWQLVEDLTVSVLAGKFRVKCSYCGMYYSDYSSCDPDGEAAAAYADYVSTLPATGYSSAGALLWQPRWIEDSTVFDISFGVFVLSSTPYYAISPKIDGYYQSNKACSVIADGSSFLFTFTDATPSSRPSLSVSGYHKVKVPVSGSYYIIASPCVVGKVVKQSQWLDFDLSWKPISVGAAAAGGSLAIAKAFPGDKNTGGSYPALNLEYISGGTLAFYSPVFQIVPVDTSIGNTTYNINTRVNNFNGDYYDSVTNNYYNNTTIVNETNNTYYDMSTNTTQNMTSWNYDYKSRTYFITLEDGTTVAVQFGDNELTITKNDETSNTYNYVIKNSGGDPEQPTTCKHNWVETIDVAPTCLEGGHASYTCSLCNETYEQVLPANGHTWTVKEHVNTVYDTDGTVLTQGHTLYECSVCGEQFYTDTGAPPPDVSGSGTVVAWLNNFQTWLDNQLNVNLTLKLDSILEKADLTPVIERLDTIISLLQETAGDAACEHTYQQDMTTEATCTLPGLMVSTCSQCGDSYSDIVDPLGHDWQCTDHVAAETDPDTGAETAAAYDVYTCSRCGDTYNDYSGEGAPEDGKSSIAELIARLFARLGKLAGDLLAFFINLLDKILTSVDDLISRFNSYTEQITGFGGAYPAWLGGVWGILPDDLQVALTFALICIVVALVGKKLVFS